MVQNPLKQKEYCVQLENFITLVFGARVFRSYLMYYTEKKWTEQKKKHF